MRCFFALGRLSRLCPMRAFLCCFILGGVAATAVSSSSAADLPRVWSDRPNAVAFAEREARFVRMVVMATNADAACIDELEIYAPGGEKNLALAVDGAKASASSCIAGYPQHKIEHLNDGRYGNDRSWVAGNGPNPWAQIELSESKVIDKVVFSRDRKRQCSDRMPVHFAVQLSSDGQEWDTVKTVKATAANVAIRPASTGGSVSITVPGAPPPPTVGGPIAQAAQPPTGEAPAVPTENEHGLANLALSSDARPAASSALSGYDVHKIVHLCDGRAGNAYSWISAGEPSWAEIDLGAEYWICQVAIGNDGSGRFRDRAISDFSILTAVKYNADGGADTWKTAYRHAGTAVQLRTPFTFQPVRARWVRVAIDVAGPTEARIDELEIFGSPDPIPPENVGPVTRQKGRSSQWVQSEEDSIEQLRYAILAEEHAWLKIHGQADLSGRLVPYNGRVQEYPRRAAPDRLPLPPLTRTPSLDGRLDDDAWQQASRGVARVAWPYDFDTGALVEYAVYAGRDSDDLYLAIDTNRLLSSHVAIVSRADGASAGVLVCDGSRLAFNVYGPAGKLIETRQVRGQFDEELTRFEVALPIAWFEGLSDVGLRVGLGLGGRHTVTAGLPVYFHDSPLSIARLDCRAGEFCVRLRLASDAAAPCRVVGDVPELAGGLTLQPGQCKNVTVSADGPIGPQFDLEIDDGDDTFVLRMLRYDPAGRVLRQFDALVGRLADKGVDVAAERTQFDSMSRRHAELVSRRQPDVSAEREFLFQTRTAKRRLFFRDGDLAPIQRLLFVKRHAFEPSHNYSVLLDSRYRGGGSVCTLEMPRTDGRLEPDRATVTTLFESGGGIARNPMANFDCSSIYFGYRPNAGGYFHVMKMAADGSALRQVTDGPFHDYWPCPLPDGGLAFISTRCRARFLCWRPQAAVLFRMEADGTGIRPLSFANLTEWGPSVMSDGRIIWQRSEYIDKGADFGHTLWSIRPDGTGARLVFGNDIIQPNGYANGREVPGTGEFLCTLVSHFGDLNGPLALLDVRRGRFNPKAIHCLTTEVPRPGMWPVNECFRDPVPVSSDHFLCSYAPRDKFAIYVVDRFGNREMLHMDDRFGSMCPTMFRPVAAPPVLPTSEFINTDSVVSDTPGNRLPECDTPEARRLLGDPADGKASGGHGAPHKPGELFVADVYQGIEPAVKRGTVKYIRVCQEVRADLEEMQNGVYRSDHPDFMEFYATPVHKVSGPFGWPSYVAKASLGITPVEEDGSARFIAPAGKVLYFQALDEDFNELQRMRSVVQLQPGERRSCIGCHDDRNDTPAPTRYFPLALQREALPLDPPPWGAVPIAYEKVVQPVLDAKCVKCHGPHDKDGFDLSSQLDAEKIPASYRTLVSGGWVHYLDCGWNSGGTEKRQALTFGTVRSKLWNTLDAGHHDVELSIDDIRRIKCWTDMNCPLWPDYIHRSQRPGGNPRVTLRQPK